MAKTPTKANLASGSSLRVLEYVLLALCLCVLALRVTYTESPTPQTSGFAGSFADVLYSLTISGLLIFALALWLVWRVCTGRFSYRITGIEIGLALFVLACVVSTAVASDKRLAITQAMTLLGPVVAAILLVQILNSTLRIQLALITIAALGVVSAYRCAEELRTVNEWTINDYEQDPEAFLRRNNIAFEVGSLQHFLWEHRLHSRDIPGYFTTSNSAASFALMASLAATALLLGRHRSSRRKKTGSRNLLYGVIAAAIIVAGLLLTRSKGGILGFLAASALLALLLGTGKWLAAHRRSALVLLPGLLVILVIVAGYAVVSYGLRHGRLPGGNSMLVRWQYWDASVQMYADHPISGVGPGNFVENYPRYKPAAALESVADPHSFLLSLLTQYGPLGLAGFLAMILVPIWKTIASRAPNVLPEKHSAASTKGPALSMLTAICIPLLLLRPALIPVPLSGALIGVVYGIVSLYVAPVAAFIIGFLLLAAPLVQASPKQDRMNHTAVMAALGCAIFGVLVHNLIDFAIFEPGVWTAFWFVLACLIAVRVQTHTPAPATRGTSGAFKLVVVVVASALLGAYWRYVWSPAARAVIYIDRAQQAISTGRFDQAHRYLDAAFGADPLSPASLSLNGRLYSQQYEESHPKQPALLEKAVEYFRRAAEVSPANYKDYERSAKAYDQLGQYQQAYESYTRAIERYPGSGQLWFHRGQVAERLDKPDMALADYRRAVEIEDAYRRQFREMYPKREKIVSRLGEDNYESAKRRIVELSQ